MNLRRSAVAHLIASQAIWVILALVYMAVSAHDLDCEIRWGNVSGVRGDYTEPPGTEGFLSRFFVKARHDVLDTLADRTATLRGTQYNLTGWGGESVGPVGVTPGEMIVLKREYGSCSGSREFPAKAASRYSTDV